MGRSTIYEVDDNVFQITTAYDDGRVTVDIVHGRDAYEAHTQRENENTHDRDNDEDRDERYSYPRRTPSGSYREMLLH